MWMRVYNTLSSFSTALSSFTVKRGGKNKTGFSQRNSDLAENTCLPGTEVNVSIFLYVLVFIKKKKSHILVVLGPFQIDLRRICPHPPSFSNRWSLFFSYFKTQTESMLAILFFGNYYT